ncbi:MAG TPA: DUF4350 domain-containing protein [Anaerolineae bacterium]|nr:DUF4350 domain-containing protein [Anaerolineae bacterium]
MKRLPILLAIGAFLLPVVIRGLWFYRGFYKPTHSITAPEYTELFLPTSPPGVKGTEVEMVDASGIIVLVDWAHENKFDITELEGFINILTELGAAVEILQSPYSSGGPYSSDATPLDQRLKYADAYIVIAPSATFSDDDVQHLTHFVERGGRLLVTCDPTRVVRGLSSYDYESYYVYSLGSVVAANSLLAPFDLTFSDGFLYNLLENEGNYRNVIFRSFGEDSLTAGLSTVAFYGVSSIVTNTGTPLIIGDRNTLSSRTDASGEWAPLVRSQNGSVIALGDLTFLTPPYDQIADNQLLISHLIDFLVSGERQQDLSDYPHIFQQPVAILESETFDLAAETLQTILGLEISLDSLDLQLSIVEEPSPDLDLIAFDSYRPSEDLRLLLEPFKGLVLPEDSEDGSLSVPGFGQLNPAGIGTMLLSRTDGRTTLILLANSRDELITLAEMLANDELYRCLLREHIALCKVGVGEGFDSISDFGLYNYDDTFYEQFPFTDEPFLPTPIPTVTP